MQPTRDLQRAQLESIIRKAWADGWALDLDDKAMASSALEAAHTAFPDLDAATVSRAMQELGLMGNATS